MRLSPDSEAVLLLTSHVGLGSRPEPAPLGLRQWNQLWRRLSSLGLAGPGSLLGLDAQQIRGLADLPQEEVDRLTRLLSRGSELVDELERLELLGLWVVTRWDEAYPERLRKRLGDLAPTVLFGSGKLNLLGKSGLAVVGSRNVDERGNTMAQLAGRACAESGLVVYSGGARGVDSIAMGAALEAGGSAVGVLADSLEKAARATDAREGIERGTLTFITPYSPSAPFSVGAAMGRNKLIYALADWALVVASDVEKGGTWAGATEALKAGWVPVFAVTGPGAPPGNGLLVERGARPFPDPFPDPPSSLGEWLEANSARDEGASQYTLF
jgi:predicted Rossmann fold nucleotide-binding protein DprA/Smf involved in DNA uptake